MGVHSGFGYSPISVSLELIVVVVGGVLLQIHAESTLFFLVYRHLYAVHYWIGSLPSDGQ